LASVRERDPEIQVGLRGHRIECDYSSQSLRGRGVAGAALDHAERGQCFNVIGVYPQHELQLPPGFGEPAAPGKHQRQVDSRLAIRRVVLYRLAEQCFRAFCVARLAVKHT
jgi:hypothetical protein